MLPRLLVISSFGTMSLLDPEIYTIAWIAPLEIEARAALLMLDKRHHGRFPLSPGDDYVFQAGEICNHNVVIATLPSGQEYGTGTAAAIASQVKKFFPRLWFGLLVGVAAGLPNLRRNPPLDIRLGDVLVGLPEGETAGLVAYDLGKERGDNEFQPLRSGHVLAQTETVVRSAIGSIKLNAPDDAEIFLPYYNDFKDKRHSNGSFADPGQETDMYYDIDDEGNERRVLRELRPASKRTRVWYGPIGSGEKLIRNPRRRNELRDRYNIIGLEMEAAGTMNRIPVGVIRGVCDYGDERKNKHWQPYASAMAAAYAKAVLAQIPPKVVVRLERQITDDGRQNRNLLLLTAKTCKANTPVCKDASNMLPNRSKRPLDDTFSTGNRMSKSPRRDDSNGNSSQTPPIQLGHLNDDRNQTLLKSLSFDQIDSRYDTIKRAYRKTCQWLSKTPEYLDWLDPNKLHDHHGFLWIKGKPGAGKSTLMKFVLNAAEKSKQSNCISFFFNARGESLERSTNGLYRSLLFQLLERIPRLQSVFDTLNQRALCEDAEWPIESLKSLFEQAIQDLNQSPLTCFIDALDECDDAQIQDMVSFFEELGEMAVSNDISFRVCLSSRHYPHITIAKGLNLDIGQQHGHGQDIIKYVNGNLKIANPEVAQQIRDRLIEKTSGIFIWLVLVIGILQQAHDDGHTHTLLQRLDDIPENLNELFHDILTRDNRHKAEVLLCIQWVLFARQPLTKEQLYSAIRVGIDPEATSISTLDNIGDADVGRFILSSSKGLVEVNRSKKNPKVQFIHESVREFFFKEDFTRIWPQLQGNFSGESHESLKQCCLDYMRMGASYITFGDRISEDIFRATTLGKIPFLEYAFRNILYHAEEAAASNIDQATFLENFDLAPWVRCELVFEKYTIRRHSPDTSTLYILAEYNAASLIGYHKDKLCGFQQQECTRYGAPILAAIATNSHEAVYALLKAQADTEPLSSSLHSLCEQYHQNDQKKSFTVGGFKFAKNGTLLDNLFNTGEDLVMAFLLATPTTLNTNIARQKIQILCDAAANGRETLVRCLLDEAVNSEYWPQWGRTALRRAVEGNHTHIVQLLLERNASAEPERFDLRLAVLHFAIQKGYEDIVRMLLRYDTNVNSRSADGSTPLHDAARRGYTTMVQLLLDKGAEIEAATKSGETPLIAAARNFQAGAVRVLIDNGANIEAANCLQRTPLTAAVHGLPRFYVDGEIPYRLFYTIQLLIDEGANVNAADCDGFSPLTMVADLPSDDPVKALIHTKSLKTKTSDANVKRLDVIELDT